MGGDPGAPLGHLAIHWGGQLGGRVRLGKRTVISPDLCLTCFQWTLATTFDPNGWFFAKLNLALAFLYWTTHFIYCDNIGANEAGRKGTDYLLVLIEYLAKDTTTEMVRDIFL